MSVAEIEAETRGIRQAFDERGDIAQGLIDALTRNGVYAMRGVTNEREAVRNEGARDFEIERPGLRARDERDRAEAAADAVIEFGEEVRRIEGEDARCRA